MDPPKQLSSSFGSEASTCCGLRSSENTYPKELLAMQLAGPDIMVSKFQVDVIVVTENLFTERTLQRAAERLLIAWPFLSFRTNFTHTELSRRADKKASDGFLSVRSEHRRILPELAGTKAKGSITVHNANVFGDLFDDSTMPWSNRLRPRIFTVQAVALEDATVFKFRMQHAAGDAVGLYKAAAAFCEGLRGDVHKRSINLKREYKVATDGKTGCRWKWHLPRSLLQTQQARDWFDVCTSSKLFNIKALASKWKTARNHGTRWQTIHFSRETIEMWQDIASEHGVKVSKFCLLASWIHLNLAAFAQSLDCDLKERFAFTASVRDSLKQTHVLDAEVWNPFTIVIASPVSQGEASKRARLIAGAVNIKNHVESVRTPAYMQDYATMMRKAPARQCQMQGLGKRIPVSMLLTSWSHAPFPELEMWSALDQKRRPTTVQPIISGLSSIPLPERGAIDRQIGVVWEGRGSNGYWLTANLEDDLWRRIFDTSL